MSLTDLEVCCNGLQSTKITERRKNAEVLEQILENPKITNLLSNSDSHLTWNHVIESVNEYLLKESNKLHEDGIKKKTTGKIGPKKTFYGNLLIDSFHLANKSEYCINISNLLQHVFANFESSTRRKYFADTYLTLLCDHILSVKSYWGKIKRNDWLGLLHLMRQLMEKSLPDVDLNKVLSCLYCIIKHGPNHQLDGMELRKEFPLITNIFKRMQDTSLRWKNEVVLNILLEFCEQTAEDNRMACCKLGEDVFPILIGLYQQVLVCKCLLLQMQLHHPKGFAKKHPAAYAFSWPDWQLRLGTLYTILCREIDQNMQIRNRTMLNFENDLKIFHSVCIKLAVEVFNQVLNEEFEETDEPAVKKSKIESGLLTIIEKIRDSKKWPWIRVIQELLKRYPVIKSADYTNLLQVLYVLQSESKDSASYFYIYECISVLLDIEDQVVDLDRKSVDPLWQLVWECAMRAAGLNQQEEITHKLIQNLIKKGKPINLSNFYQTYISGVINVNQFNLTTLSKTFEQFGFPETIQHNSIPHKTRDVLLNWIFAVETNIFSFCAEKITAQTLVNLTLKQWHKFHENEAEMEEMMTIEDIYVITSSGTIPNPKKKTIESCTKNVKNNNISHGDIYANLLKYTTELTNRFLTMKQHDELSIKNMLTLLIFLGNLTSSLVRVDLIDEKKVDEFELMRKMDQMFYVLLEIFNNFESKSDECKLEMLRQINYLMCADFHPSVSIFIRHTFPAELLRVFFYILNDDKDSAWRDRKGRLLSMKILCNFSCLKDMPVLNETQLHVMEILFSPDFDPCQPNDYEMAIEFLSSAWKCSEKSLPDTMVNSLIQSVQKICQVYNTNCETALNVIRILKKLSVHISHASLATKTIAINVLYPFFERRNNYSRAVSIELINSIVEFSKLNPELDWAVWNHQPIAMHLADFLHSDFHIVRIYASEAIKDLFLQTFNTEEKTLYSLSIQNELFDCIYEQSKQVFYLEGNLSEEQQIDESVSRTASVLLTYASLICTSSIWRQKALFTLIKLIQSTQINNSVSCKVLDTVAKHLQFKNVICFIEDNLSYLLMNWFIENRTLDTFPYFLINCNSYQEFQTKYCVYLFPFYTEDLDFRTNCDTHMSFSEVVNRNYPEMMANYFAIKTKKDTQNVLETSTSFILNYYSILTELTPGKTFQDEIHQIITHIIKLIYDMQHFKNNFNVNLILPEPKPPFFTVGLILNTFGYIGTLLEENQSVLQFLMSKPSSIERILLNLSKEIAVSCSLEQKLLAFHQYTVFINLITPFLENQHLTAYIIRAISFSLLHLIIQSEINMLNVVSCQFLQQFLEGILADYNHVFKHFFTLFVSSLVPMAKNKSMLSSHCLKLLEFIVITNKMYFENDIGLLDPFPNEEIFKNIQEVYISVKYHKSFTLEEEIEAFLHTGNLLGNGNRLEGLKHIKSELSKRKVELTSLYKKINVLKGLCNASEKSIMHRFTYTLLKLARSSDEEESIEATRCLGELGSADLLTVVLHTEKHNQVFKYKGFDLITKEILLLLSDYLVDSNVKVVEATSDALYNILSYKEAKRVLIMLPTEDEINTLNESYFTPFIATKLKNGNRFVIKTPIIQNETIWNPTQSHQEWITTLTCSILEAFDDNCYLKSLKPLCLLQVNFCERLFPLLIYIILHSNSNQKSINNISLGINHFFKENIRLIESVRCMLNMVDLVRIQSYLNNMNLLLSLKLNYLHVAEAAEFCSNPFAALWYTELWCQENIRIIKSNHPQVNERSSNLLESIYQYSNVDDVKKLQDILQKCYEKVGETDALNSLGAMNLLDRNQLIEHYKQMKLWNQVVLHYDLEVGRGHTSSTPSLLNALKNSALFHLPLNYSDCAENQYECFWRLNKWDLNPINSINQNENHYDKYQYYALKSLHDDDFSMLNECVSHARNCVKQAIKHASLESTKNVYNILTQLQSLIELEDFAHGKQTDNFTFVLEKWRAQDLINRNEFQFVEPIRAQRITMLRDLEANERLIKEDLVISLLKLSELARNENDNNIAIRSLNLLTNLTNLSDEVRHRTHLEEAQVHWSVNKSTGKSILHNLLNKPLSQRLRAFALKLYGTWMVNTQSVNSYTIIKDYFLESLNILTALKDRTDDERNIMDGYSALARFADTQYQHVLGYMKSPTFECKVQNMEKSKKAAAEMQSKQKRSEDEKRAVYLHKKHCEIDQAEINSAQMEKNMYLTLAMKYYLKYLQYCAHDDVSVFRILSLWLENRNNTDLAALMTEYLPIIASYKFILVLPQLVPHISPNDDVFSRAISNIIRTCAKDHPHHTLPVILAVANSLQDKKFDKSNTTTSSNEPRIIEANKIIAELLNQPTMKQIVQRMKILSDALIDFAYYDSKQSNTDNENKNSNCPIPRSFALHNIRDYDDILLPTYTLPINKSCNYSNIIGIHSFGKSFARVGGVNAPKRITCMGTDGITRTQLVKGKDDLRQDAVMQQVFTIMNNLLRKEKRTNLVIRTYKVVPLSQRSGILEWVENSMPIGEYLMEAHPKYHPNDISPSTCRSQLIAAAKSTNENKLKVYTKITSKFQPVFHKFFETSFLQPAVWYERRRAYMNSVATSSMCGYILGLGDRHVQNILLDKSTAEVIHIDFGIAFEQGRILPTPETIPFRLTRDIEDGMGVLGIEGVFRRSCEKTMEVLRRNSETIISILEVLLYDPLYTWTITPQEAYNRQMSKEDDKHNITFSDNENVPVNVTAERAILRLRQKLQGTEEGSASSVEGQVEKLIQKARDPVNLSRLYSGWQPYF